METVIDIFLTVLGIYILAGILFGLYFIFGGAVKLDPLMGDSKKRVRLLLMPGCIAVWPLLLRRMIKAKQD